MRIAICDDETIWRQRIQQVVEQAAEKLQISADITCYGDGNKLLETEEAYDLLFLDIEMEEISGIEIKRTLAERNADTEIVFITSHQERMRETFGPRVIGFLDKPVDQT